MKLGWHRGLFESKDTGNKQSHVESEAAANDV